MTNNNNTTDKGNTMTTDIRRELTHSETIVAIRNGIELCRPSYGFRWSIQQPTSPGHSRCLYIGSERQIRATWNAHYANAPIDIRWKSPNEHA